MTAKHRTMSFPVGIFFLIIMGIESIVSLLANGFIILANGYSWLQSRKLLPCDFLLTTLSLSRFFSQGVMISKLLYLSYSETYVHSKEEKILSISWMYLNLASLWCAMWLNVFYCVKVTNFALPLFAWLKLRIGVLTPRCLGISLLAFVICTIHPVIRCFEEGKWRNLTGDLPENTSQSENQDPYQAVDKVQFYFIAVSFSICLTASGVLLLSLWRHRKNLKKSGLSMKDVSTQTHLSVMKPLLLLLFFYILHFAAMSIVFTDLLRYGTLERMISDMVLLVYPAAHPIILIFTNPKLNKAYIHAIRFGRSAC